MALSEEKVREYIRRLMLSRIRILCDHGFYGLLLESFGGVKKIKPAGGGTDFQIIFEYIHLHMTDRPPMCVIILTDGYAPFPQEHLANGIPVLWLLNNENITPRGERSQELP